MAEALLVSTELAASVLDLAAENRRKVLPTSSGERSGGMVVRPGDRQEALEFVRLWMRQHECTHLILCDPYFTAGDVEFLRIVVAERPQSRVIILTKQNEALTADACRSEWDKLMDEEPPYTEVISVWIAGDSKPVLHDRWLIAGGRGLRLGTSFNSLGNGKLSEISELEPQRAADVLSELNRFIGKERIFAGRRLLYSTFTL